MCERAEGAWAEFGSRRDKDYKSLEHRRNTGPSDKPARLDVACLLSSTLINPTAKNVDASTH